MGDRELIWQPKAIIGGNKMALGLSISDIPLCSLFLEGENQRKTGQTSEEIDNSGRHSSQTTNHRKNMVKNSGKVLSES